MLPTPCCPILVIMSNYVIIYIAYITLMFINIILHKNLFFSDKSRWYVMITIIPCYKTEWFVFSSYIITYSCISVRSCWNYCTKYDVKMRICLEIYLNINKMLIYDGKHRLEPLIRNIYLWKQALMLHPVLLLIFKTELELEWSIATKNFCYLL